MNDRETITLLVENYNKMRDELIFLREFLKDIPRRDDIILVSDRYKDRIYISPHESTMKIIVGEEKVKEYLNSEYKDMCNRYENLVLEVNKGARYSRTKDGKFVINRNNLEKRKWWQFKDKE